MMKIRKLGKITDDLEVLLEEMTFQHEMQHGEVLALVHNWLMVHAPGAQEEYEDGTTPVFKYGPELENIDNKPDPTPKPIKGRLLNQDEPPGSLNVGIALLAISVMLGMFFLGIFLGNL